MWSHRKPTEYTCSYEDVKPSSSPSRHLQNPWRSCCLQHSNETEQASLSTGLECGVEQWNGTTKWKMEWISKYTVAADLCN